MVRKKQTKVAADGSRELRPRTLPPGEEKAKGKMPVKADAKAKGKMPVKADEKGKGKMPTIADAKAAEKKTVPSEKLKIGGSGESETAQKRKVMSHEGNTEAGGSQVKKAKTRNKNETDQGAAGGITRVLRSNSAKKGGEAGKEAVKKYSAKGKTHKQSVEAIMPSAAKEKRALMAEGEDYVDDHPNRRNLHDQPNTADLTYLSRKLEHAVVGCRRPVFSWVTPALYRVSGWRQFQSPVPAVVDQGSSGRCIPYQVYNFIRLQINLIVRLSDRVLTVALPEISLAYLVDVFKALPIAQRTFTHFLSILHNEGFLRRQDYDEQSGCIAPNAQRLYIHWCKVLRRPQRIWGRGHLESLQFESSIKFSILYYGGVLTEMCVPVAEIDHTGVQGGRRVPLRLTDAGVPLAHALLIVGWEVIENEVLLMYQNSYGELWGSPPCVDSARYGFRRGFGFVRTEKIDHVYVPQLRQWKDFNLTFYIGVSRTTTGLYSVIKLSW